MGKPKEVVGVDQAVKLGKGGFGDLSIRPIIVTVRVMDGRVVNFRETVFTLPRVACKSNRRRP